MQGLIFRRELEYNHLIFKKIVLIWKSYFSVLELQKQLPELVEKKLGIF
ncbi:hypothetical protein B711_0222 [Chlamydia psittaci CP3]|nr:hypothetical protein B711_0222 [Chlamydia psittaci CP3]KPZ37263.1 hypothetical protein GWK_03110 [Chlamydia psittaci CP3]